MKKIIPINPPALPQERRLTAAQFQALADVPPKAEWFANLAAYRHGAPTRTT
jgi:hypothetical protein